MKYSSPVGIKRLAMVAAALLLAAAFAACTSATGTPPAADGSEPALSESYVPAVESAGLQPSETPKASGSGWCAGCFSHTGNDPDTPAPSPYAIGGVVVRYDDTPGAGKCSGQCVEGCGCACADSGCTGEASSDSIPGGECIAGQPVAGNPGSMAQTACACGCECEN
jgi:hypothetical protein